MFVCIKMSAECNETTPAIAFDRFHENSDLVVQKWRQILTRIALETSSNVKLEKNQGNIYIYIYMEVVTFELSMKVVAMHIYIYIYTYMV